MRPGLRLPYHRGTTAHVSSIYPWSVQPTFGCEGMYVGLDLLAGGAEFIWDPFSAYRQGLATNGNCWVLGEPGFGKSSLVKSLLWRMAAVFGLGEGGRWLAILDPKGEYAPLAERLGLTTIRLSPGGTTRINPLSPGPAAAHEPPERQVLRQAATCTALVATVLDRPLSQLEDALIFAAVEHLTRSSPETEPTLVDLAHLVTEPSSEIAAQLRRQTDDLIAEGSAVGFALQKLLTRSLRGMFDGASTIPLRWDGPGIVVDISAVPMDSEALPLVMVAAMGWLQELLACPGPQRVLVLDEVWAILGSRFSAAYVQSWTKLGRAYGVAPLFITHRPSDLVAQSDDGSSAAKIAAGLISDAATKIILRQAPDQLDAAVSHFGLSLPEAQIVGQLARGRAVWKIGGGRTAVVQHVLAPAEVELCDTDARMAPRHVPLSTAS